MLKHMHKVCGRSYPVKHRYQTLGVVRGAFHLHTSEIIRLFNFATLILTQTYNPTKSISSYNYSGSLYISLPDI